MSTLALHEFDLCMERHGGNQRPHCSCGLPPSAEVHNVINNKRPGPCPCGNDAIASEPDAMRSVDPACLKVVEALRYCAEHARPSIVQDVARDALAALVLHCSCGAAVSEQEYQQHLVNGHDQPTTVARCGALLIRRNSVQRKTRCTRNFIAANEKREKVHAKS